MDNAWVWFLRMICVLRSMSIRTCIKIKTAYRLCKILIIKFTTPELWFSNHAMGRQWSYKFENQLRSTPPNRIATHLSLKPIITLFQLWIIRRGNAELHQRTKWTTDTKAGPWILLSYSSSHFFRAKRDETTPETYTQIPQSCQYYHDSFRFKLSQILWLR